MARVMMKRILKIFTSIPSLIVISSIIAVILNVYLLLFRFTTIFDPLFYIPIILVAYFYPRRGILVAGAFAVVYLAIVLVIPDKPPEIMLTSLGHLGIFVLIGFVVSYLSTRYPQEIQKPLSDMVELSFKRPRLIPILIIITSGAAIFLNFYLLLFNHSLIFDPLFYFPIILVAYFYPDRGVVTATWYAVLFLMMVMMIPPRSLELFLSSLGHSGFFIIISFVVSSLVSHYTHEREIHQHLSEIVKTSIDAIIGVTLDGTITDWDKGAKHLFMYTAEEVIGRSINLLTPPDQAGGLVSLLEKIRRGEPVERYETERVRKDGSRIWISLSVSPIKNDRGVVIGASVIAIDISERKRVEEALRESERKYRELVELLPQTVFEIDRTGTITSANSVALNTFGYTKEDLAQGVHAGLVVSPDDHTRLGENIQRILQGEQLGGIGYLAQRKDGTVFPAIIYSNAILHENIPVGIRGVLIDVTELKKAQEALEVANKKLQLLNSITRHDILNQITVLNIYHNLTEGLIDNPEILSYLQAAKMAADSISRQISFTHEYQDIGVSEPAWQNVQKHFLNAAASLNTRAITIEPCQQDITVYADPLLEKVFYNLIDNSLRHGEKCTKIRLTHREDTGGLALVYEDDGVGILQKDKQKIFNKGFGKNTGLGLFLVREILAITGITITENGEPHKGVRFEMRVPKDMYRFTDTTQPS